jgi:hypothetical protein
MVNGAANRLRKGCGMTPGEIDRHIEMILQKQTQLATDVKNLRILVAELAAVVRKLSELSGEHFARDDEDRLAKMARLREHSPAN